MTCTIDEKAKTLTIVLDLETDPKPSSSGKSFILGTTRGPIQATGDWKGKPFYYSANVYYKK